MIKSDCQHTFTLLLAEDRASLLGSCGQCGTELEFTKESTTIVPSGGHTYMVKHDDDLRKVWGMILEAPALDGTAES